MSKPLRWGIISTGGIATNFSKVTSPPLCALSAPTFTDADFQDLLCDPKNRDASDVQHVITAIGSRSVPSAEKFLDKLQKADAPADWGGKNGKLEGCKAYGSYEEVYADPVSHYGLYVVIVNRHVGGGRIGFQSRGYCKAEALQEDTSSS